MVIGSGAARRAPARAEGDTAFAGTVAEIAEMARPYGIAIAPESLNRTETNVGNDLRSLALAVRGKASYTADSYHVLFEWDADGRRVPVEELWIDQIPYAPAHVHIADLRRFSPRADDPMLQGFAERLSELNYEGAVSLECRRHDGLDFGEALAELRALFRA